MRDGVEEFKRVDKGLVLCRRPFASYRRAAAAGGFAPLGGASPAQAVPWGSLRPSPGLSWGVWLWHGTAWLGMAQHGMARHDMAWHSVV